MGGAERRSTRCVERDNCTCEDGVYLRYSKRAIAANRHLSYAKRDLLRAKRDLLSCIHLAHLSYVIHVCPHDVVGVVLVVGVRCGGGDDEASARQVRGQVAVVACCEQR